MSVKTARGYRISERPPASPEVLDGTLMRYGVEAHGVIHIVRVYVRRNDPGARLHGPLQWQCTCGEFACEHVGATREAFPDRSSTPSPAA